MSAIAPDGVSFENWIGRSHAREDALTPRIAAEFEARGIHQSIGAQSKRFRSASVRSGR